MVAKIALWIVVKLAEAIASKYLTYERGQLRRTWLVDYLIKRAEKAKTNATTADNDLLLYWAGILKSERLKDALQDRQENGQAPMEDNQG